MHLNEALEVFDLAMVTKSPETRRWYRQKLAPLVEYLGGDREVESITIVDLWRWQSWLAEQDVRYANHPTKPTVAGGLSLYSLRGHAKAVRRFFRWLKQRGYLPSNPAEELEIPEEPDVEPKAAEVEDMSRLLEVARNSPRDYAIVAFLIDTGCRVGGLINLRLSDLQLDQRRATVLEKGRGGGKRRSVYLVPITVQALRAWLHIRPTSESDRVFLGSRGPLTASGVYQALARLAKRAGITGRFNPHSFRHAFARDLLERGADLGTVSQLMGHTKINVTHKFYARWVPTQLQERHDRFSWLAHV